MVILGSSIGSVTVNVPLAIVTSLAHFPASMNLAKFEAHSNITLPHLNVYLFIVSLVAGFEFSSNEIEVLNDVSSSSATMSFASLIVK
jgi:hypothetical protein